MKREREKEEKTAKKIKERWLERKQNVGTNNK
jgi:hypothetical protein